MTSAPKGEASKPYTDKKTWPVPPWLIRLEKQMATIRSRRTKNSSFITYSTGLEHPANSKSLHSSKDIIFVVVAVAVVDGYFALHICLLTEVTISK